MEVHDVLRPAEGRDGAGVRPGVPDGLHPVRTPRGAQGEGQRKARDGRRGRRNGCPTLRGGRGRVRHGSVLPPARRPRSLPPAARPGGGHAQIRVFVGICGRRGGVPRSRGGRRVRGRQEMSGERHYAPVHSATQQGAEPDGRGWVREVPEEEVRSYYGRPVLKEPTWTWEIPWYFFFGGLAGASSVLSLSARAVGNDALARRALLVALGGAAVS